MPRKTRRTDHVPVTLRPFFGVTVLSFYTGVVRASISFVLAMFLCSVVRAADKPAIQVLRFDAADPNCTVRIADDGHVYYALSSANYEITLGVDRQELEKVPHRVLPMIGVLVRFQYKGDKKFDVQQNRFTLEFVKHFQVVQSSLDPDSMLQTLQDNVDDLTDEVERHQLKHHPDNKEKAEGELQARLKDYTEMMDFISTRALRPTTLDPANATVEGWVFFNTRNRWIGGWRRPEQFVLRMPVQNLMIEIPFELPPKQGKVELRKREP